MFDELNKNSLEVGLHVNTEKICITVNVGKEEKICLGMQEIKKKDLLEIIYLGKLITVKDQTKNLCYHQKGKK